MEMSLFLLEMNFGNGGQVIIITIFPFEVVEQPFLIGKAVLQVGKHERDHVVQRFQGGKVGPVRCFLEAQELHDP